MGSGNWERGIFDSWLGSFFGKESDRDVRRAATSGIERPRGASSCLCESLESRICLSGSIALGGVATGSIAAKGQIDVLTFTGTANQVIRIAVANNTDFFGNYNQVTELRTPAGVVVGTTAPGTQKQFTLPVSGTYTIRIHDDNFTDTGNYAVGLEGTLPLSPDASPIVLGNVFAGSISTQAKEDTLTFSAHANDVIRLAVANNTDFFGNYNQVTELRSPSGAVLGTVAPGKQGEFTLPSTGKYSIDIHDDNFTDTGSYTVGLEGTSPASPDAYALTAGPAVDRSLSTQAQEDVLTFFASAHDDVQIAVANNTDFFGNYNQVTTLFSPSGTQIGTIAPGAQQEFVLPATGTYSIRVHDDNFTDTGKYDVSINWITPLDGSIAGQVFNDANGNGAKDSGETGLQGRTIFLDANNNGSLDIGERSTTSDILGNYAFTGLPAATYVVREVLPAGSTLTRPSSGFYTVPLALASNVGGKDFGNRIGGAAPVVSIMATDPTATEPSTPAAVAADTGLYTITRTGSTSAPLIVNFVVSGSATNGIDYTAISSPVTIAAGASSTTIKLIPLFDTLLERTETAVLTLTSSAAYSLDPNHKSAQVNIQDTKPNVLGTISGSVFHDFNGNGALDSGELKLAGWTVFIDKNGNNKLDAGETSVVSDSSGSFKFTRLVAGAYRVVEARPAGWIGTGSSATGVALSLPAGGTVSANFGNARPVSISGTVFNDANANGFRDPGEAVSAGWTVFIDANNNGKLDAGEISVVAGASGTYAFSGLAPGSYVIRLLPKTGSTITSPPGDISKITLASGMSVSGLDFGVK